PGRIRADMRVPLFHPRGLHHRPEPSGRRGPHSQIVLVRAFLQETTTMKLVRFGPKGREKPGIVDKAGVLRDLSGVISDITPETLAAGAIAKIKKVKAETLPAAPKKVRIGPCVGSVRNFIAIGLNYVDHAHETGSPIPKEPIVFNK